MNTFPPTDPMPAMPAPAAAPVPASVPAPAVPVAPTAGGTPADPAATPAASFEQLRAAQRKALVGGVLRRTLGEVALFIVAFAVCAVVAMVFYGTVVTTIIRTFIDVVGHGYRLYEMAPAAGALLLAATFVGGIVVIVRRCINRALGYFDDLLGQVSDIVAKREGAVRLPPELAPTAMALNQVKAEAARADRAARAAEERKNELVMYLAHDIKTPLTSIVGYLTLLEESPDLPREQRARYAGITLAKAYRLEELLDEFFEISRYNLQAIPIERSRFDGALFVQQVIEEFYPAAEARGIELAYHGPAELSVFADAGRVSRVLNNVVKNAVAYADAHSTVHIRTNLTVGEGAFVWWELSVTDQGREISPEHLSRIFEKFFRIDDARGSAGGAGLGLAIAREIARAHGGDIHAESDAGLTTFTIRIPQGPVVSS